MDNLNKIYNWKRAYINLEELEGLIHPVNYKDLYQCVNTLIKEGKIKPVIKDNLKNGMHPSLYIKYRILKEKEDNTQPIKEIKTLHPSMNISGYLKQVNKYTENRHVILELSNFLKNNDKSLKEPMSKNERAYAIWGYEKALDQSNYKYVVEFNHLREKLNYYLTPEPFFDFILKDKEVMNVLIVENKDPWYTLCKILSDMQNETKSKDKSYSLFGKTIDVILYGEGNKINKSRALEDYETKIIGRKLHFFYWGDLDYEGIYLFLKVKEQNPAIKIQLFSELYSYMLKLITNRTIRTVEKNQKNRIQDQMQLFLENFEEKEQHRIIDILTRGKYIPQEIINYPDYKELIK